MITLQTVQYALYAVAIFGAGIFIGNIISNRNTYERGLRHGLEHGEQTGFLIGRDLGFDLGVIAGKEEVFAIIEQKLNGAHTDG